MKLQPLKQFKLAARRNIRVLLSDIDDTMTNDGLLPSSTLRALEEIQQAGILVVPVTGRPAGWCDHIARMWPVDAVVGENGAFYFAYDQSARKMRSGFVKDEAERARDRAKLNDLRTSILAAVPGAGIASDQDYRIADLAIDFCEDVEPLPSAAIDKIVSQFAEAGATAKISSIHVNGWFGDYDKLSMSRRCLAEMFDIDMDAENESIVFAGDSPNDCPMFGFFKNSVGVANVRHFELPEEPAFVTDAESGNGFAELAACLLAAQSGG
jgi:HAD superfamily hydrolase (TIGR01484 family)